YPVYPALLGPPLKQRFRVPFVLDYQDPWVGAWGATVGAGPNGSRDWKSPATRRLGTWLEPRAGAPAHAPVAVSQGALDPVVRRTRVADEVPGEAIPLGFEPADFERLGSRPRSHAYFDPADGRVHLCYVGTLLPAGIATLCTLLGAVRSLAARDQAAADRLRLHFFGTSNQSTSSRGVVAPSARESGADALVPQGR